MNQTHAAADAPSLERIWDVIQAYQKTRALEAAITLDLFTAIGEGASNASALAERCRASARGVRILSDYLAIQGLLIKRDGQYELTPSSAAFLDRRSPHYLGGVVGFLNHDYVMSAFDNLAEAVRRGGSILEDGGSTAREHPVWVDFAREMKPLAAPAAEAVGDLVAARRPQAERILDIAASHGLYGVALARRLPAAEVIAVDWPDVLEAARETAEKAGVAERHRLLPGSAFDVELPAEVDVALVTNFLHHFDRKDCEKVMRKIRQSLSPQGLAAVLEFVPNEDRVTPPPAAAFSLTMLASTASGDAYTYRELDEMLRAAGFARTEWVDLPESPQRLILAAFA